MSDINEALERLRAHLFVAKEIRHKSALAGREAAIVALNGIVEFIESVEDLKAQEFAAPLAMLAAALVDLEKGTVSGILMPVPRSGRPKDASNWEAMKGLAAATMEILMCVFGREAAAKSVASVLEREGIKLDGRTELTWRTVAGWRDQLKSFHEDSQAKEAYRHLMQIHQELSEHGALLQKLDTPAKSEKFRDEILIAFTKTLRNFRD